MQQQFLAEWQRYVDIGAKHYGYSADVSPSTICGCVEQALSWLQADQIPVALLGRHFIRRLLISPYTGTVKELALSRLFEHIDITIGCPATDSRTGILSHLLSLVNDFLQVRSDPLQPNTFQQLDSRWPRLQNRATMAVDHLLRTSSPYCTETFVFLEELFTCWRRSLSVLFLTESVDCALRNQYLRHLSMLIVQFLHMVFVDAQGSSLNLSSSLLDQLLRLAEKLTELILYGSSKFTFTSQPSLFSANECEYLVTLICDISFSTDPDSTLLLQHLAASGDAHSHEWRLLNLLPCRTLLYIVVRVAGSLPLESPRLPFLLDAFGKAVVAAGSTNCPDHNGTSLERNTIQIFLTDDVRLFRVLLTLLQLENKLIKARMPILGKVPSAHQLFVELLRSICFEHCTVLDWLVSPETDCLAYLLSYCKRVVASSATTADLHQSNVWALPVTPSPASHHHPDSGSPNGGTAGYPSQEIVTFLRRLSASLRLHESQGTMPYSPRLLISRLQAAADIISRS